MFFGFIFYAQFGYLVAQNPLGNAQFSGSAAFDIIVAFQGIKNQAFLKHLKPFGQAVVYLLVKWQEVLSDGMGQQVNGYVVAGAQDASSFDDVLKLPDIARVVISHEQFKGSLVNPLTFLRSRLQYLSRKWSSR